MKVSLAAAVAATLGLCAASARAQDVEPPVPVPLPVPLPPPPATPAPPPPKADENKGGSGNQFFYLEGETGGAFVNMESFSSTNLSLQSSKSGGSEFGVGAGLRFGPLQLGGRLRELNLSAIGSLLEMDGELAFHVRALAIDPYFGVRGGYTWIGTLNADSVSGVATGGSSSSVAVHGFNLGPLLGLDIYLARILTIGIEGEVEFLFLKRPPPPLPNGVTEAMLSPQQKTLYEESGSSAGLGGVVTAHLGLHF
jgi:hypothetical protein